MQMVNEVTVMQSNKNVFNKILAELRKNKSKVPELRQVRYINLGIYSLRFQAVFKYDIGKIYTIQEPGLVFFCADITPRLVEWGGTYKDDPALSAIDFIKGKLSGNSRFRVLDKDFEKDLIDDGISETSTIDDIRKSKTYLRLSEIADKLKDVKYKVRLVDIVQKRLKTRENIIPLVIYKVESDEFDYPYKDTLASNPNAVSCRHCVTRGRLHLRMHEMCEQAMIHIPFRAWTILVMDSPLASVYRLY